MEQIIEDCRRFFADAELTCEQPCSHVPNQMLTVLDASDGDDFAVDQENAAGSVAIVELNALQVFVQSSHDGGVPCLVGRADATIGAPIKDVAIMETRHLFPATFLDAE